MLRLSGPAASRAASALAGSLPPARTAGLRRLADPATGELLDQALALWFPAPASFTGEDVVEFQLHGGGAVVASVVEALLAQGLRLAEPGEFSRRAFSHGKLELSQAEAIADLVDAENQAQRRQALAQLDGALAARYAGWRERLIEALAQLEAAIDFPDEDLPAEVGRRAAGPLLKLQDEIAAALAETRGERVREGYRIALIGAPNAGKSSLMNALLQRDAMIVTDRPGTTRDLVEAPLSVAGYRVLLADMAGLRESEDEIELEGVRRARAWAEAADLRLWVVDGSRSDGAWRQAAPLLRACDLLVLTKDDLAAGADAAAAASAVGAQVTVSVRAEGGLDPLTAWLDAHVAKALGGADFPAVTRLRHRRLLEEAAAHLDRGLAMLGGDAELAAEDVRLAARALERLSGRIDPEAVLDRVFSTFCIGK